MSDARYFTGIITLRVYINRKDTGKKTYDTSLIFELEGGGLLKLTLFLADLNMQVSYHGRYTTFLPDDKLRQIAESKVRAAVNKLAKQEGYRASKVQIRLRKGT